MRRTRWRCGSRRRIPTARWCARRGCSSRACGRAAQDARRFGSSYDRATFALRLWHLGTWEAQAGTPALAEHVARELERRAALGPDSGDVLLARSVGVRGAAAAARTGGDSVAVIA